jgi:hypothetical protein
VLFSVVFYTFPQNIFIATYYLGVASTLKTFIRPLKKYFISFAWIVPISENFSKQWQMWWLLYHLYCDYICVVIMRFSSFRGSRVYVNDKWRMLATRSTVRRTICVMYNIHRTKVHRKYSLKVRYDLSSC